MFKYQIPDSPDPDYMVVLDAVQAESFINASNAAMGVLAMMMRDETALGVLRSRTAYLTGLLDLDKATIVGARSVDQFGTDYLMENQRAIIRTFRQYLNGHVKQALNTTLSALRRTTLNLVFFSGGPLFLIPPQEPDGNHRFAVIRFEGAKDMATERKCVKANQLSKEAYESLWSVLAEKQKQAGDDAPPSDPSAPNDVLDQPLVAPTNPDESAQGQTNKPYKDPLLPPQDPPASASVPNENVNIQTNELPF